MFWRARKGIINLQTHCLYPGYALIEIQCISDKNDTNVESFEQQRLYFTMYCLVAIKIIDLLRYK